MVILSNLDSKIRSFFKFNNEEFWIIMAIPITIFVIVSIVLFVREYKKAKNEERAKKKWVKILFVVGVVVGSIELLVLSHVLIVLVLFYPKFLLPPTVILAILAIVRVVRYVREINNAMIEERPIKNDIKVKFIIALVICLIIICILWRIFFG